MSFNYHNFKFVIFCCLATAVASCGKSKVENPVFSITINAENGSAHAYVDNIETARARHGDTVTVKAQTDNPDYFFTGWTSSPEVDFALAAQPTTTFVMPENDIEITAGFSLKSYPVNFTGEYPEGRITVSADDRLIESGEEIAVGTEVSISVSANEGYLFTGWQTEGILLSDDKATTQTFKMPGNTVSISAGFEIDGYMLTFSAGEGGWLEVSAGGEFIESGTKLPEGTEINIRAVAERLFEFDGMDIEGVPDLSHSDSPQIDFTMPAGDVAVSASFTQLTSYPIYWEIWDLDLYGPSSGTDNTIEVRIDANGNGTVSDEEDMVRQGDLIPEGTTIYLKAIPDAGHNFYCWMSNDGREFIPTGSSTDMTGADAIETSFTLTSSWTKGNQIKINPVFQKK